jgi:hypothetical protein
MRSPIRRHALVLALILATGAAEVGFGFPQRATPPLPEATALVAGSGWQVEGASQPVTPAMDFQQWGLRDAVGNEALLFVKVTTHPQVVLHWDGELGFQGEGYEVTDRGERALRLSDGRTVETGRAEVQRLADRLLLEYAVVAPDGVAARGTGPLLRTAWDALRGQHGPYYLVRVAVTKDGGLRGAVERSDRLLATVLATLLAHIEGGSRARERARSEAGLRGAEGR